MLEHLLPFPRFTFLRTFIVITHPWSILWSGILAIKVCYHRPLMQARVFNESFTGFCFLINKPVMQRKIMKFPSPANLLQYFWLDNIYFYSFWAEYDPRIHSETLMMGVEKTQTIQSELASSLLYSCSRSARSRLSSLLWDTGSKTKRSFSNPSTPPCFGYNWESIDIFNFS